MMNPDPKSSRVSMRDIARKVGVSHVTVSLALRNQPRISETMRKQIRDLAEEMGYRPDPMLTALAHYRKGKSETPIAAGIAWINAWENPHELRNYREFDLYWKGASTAAEKYGYRLEEFQFGETCTAKRLHQILSTRSIRGILLPPQANQPTWNDFPWGEYSIVRFGRSLQTPRSHLVTADQVANTMMAFEKMRERGYKRIGFVTDERNMRQGHLFVSGYLTAQRFITEEDRMPVFASNLLTGKEQAAALAHWIESNHVEAILTDVAGLPSMLEQLGIRVPQDIALASTTILDANIDSGIDQHAEEIGRVGLLMLNSLIHDGSRGVPHIFRQILVEGSWVDGTSLPDKRKQ